MMRPSSARGFTLIEVMMSVALVSVVILAAILVLLDQERLFRVNADQRDIDESARAATDALNFAIGNAGYGMDPNLAFDFQYYKCQDNADGTGKIKTAACVAGTRESTTKPDELVVYSRDPSYRVWLDSSGAYTGHVWRTAGATASTLTLANNTVNYAFAQGQILLVSCPGGQTYTYVTVGTSVAAGTTTLTLETTPSDPFHQQSALPTNGCFGSGAYVFLINRQRFFIAAYPDHPYLMMDPGIDLNGDGTIDAKDVVPVAPNVEDIQFGYQMNTTVEPQDGVLFDGSAESVTTPPADGNQATPCADITVPYYAARCFFERPSNDPARLTNNPANITNVRIAMSIRSDRADPNLRNSQKNKTIPALFDRAQVDITTTAFNGEYSSVSRWNAGYRRSIVRLAVGTPNLASRGLFLW
ncbi:MAG: prepilin-type N-terminal cleavage/methylation domain-containing protein [Deltaproteobacteria bacterium]|nr:prepilin-type N-terminal cleavage/methylation domain-containing protein [Deltaproteobacteria bacterium]